MTLATGLVRIGGPAILFFGLLFAAVPGVFTEMAGITATPAGTTDLRAIYGGFQIGLGVFLIWCGRDPTRIDAGLVAFFLSVGAVGGTRLLGLFVDGEVDAFQLGSLAVEATTASLVALALSRRRSATPV